MRIRHVNDRYATQAQYLGAGGGGGGGGRVYYSSDGALVSTFGMVPLLPGILLILKLPPLTFGAPYYCLRDH